MSVHFWRILIPLPPNVSIFTTYIMSALFGEFFTPPFPSSCWRNIWRIPNPFVAPFFMSTLKFFGGMHSTVNKSVQKVKKKSSTAETTKNQLLLKEIIISIINSKMHVGIYSSKISIKYTIFPRVIYG